MNECTKAGVKILVFPLTLLVIVTTVRTAQTDSIMSMVMNWLVCRHLANSWEVGTLDSILCWETAGARLWYCVELWILLFTRATLC